MLFKPPRFHIKTTKTCWPTHNRQFFERTEILFLGFFPRNCCNNSFYRGFRSLGASHDRLASRGTCTPSGYPVLNPVNYMGVSFFILVSVPVETKCCVISCGWFFHLTVSCFRGKVPIGSACPLSSNSAVHCAFLPYRSCFLQLLWRVMFILHTLNLLSGSLATMSLACSPIASPVSFLLALFL